MTFPSVAAGVPCLPRESHRESVPKPGVGPRRGPTLGASLRESHNPTGVAAGGHNPVGVG